MELIRTKCVKITPKVTPNTGVVVPVFMFLVIFLSIFSSYIYRPFSKPEITLQHILLSK